VAASLSDPDPRTREAAARAVGDRVLPLHRLLIARLTDEDVAVRAAARRGLVLLVLQEMDGRPVPSDFDHGPLPSDGKEAQQEAARRWAAWWDRAERARPGRR